MRRIISSGSPSKPPSTPAATNRAIPASIHAHERVSRLLDMRVDGEIDKSMFLAKSAEANKGIEEGERALGLLRQQLLTTDGGNAERVVRAIQLLIGGQPTLDGKQKGAILRSAVRRVDAIAVRSDLHQPRGFHGQYASGRRASWKVERLRFHFDLAGKGGAGSSDTASACCVEVAVAVGGDAGAV